MKILAKGISMFPTLMDGMVYKVKPCKSKNGIKWKPIL